MFVLACCLIITFSKISLLKKISFITNILNFLVQSPVIFSYNETKEWRMRIMHLVDVSNSYSRKIKRELEVSTAHFIKIYTLGNTRVVYKRKAQTDELLVSNRLRPVSDQEIDFVLKKLVNLTQKDAQITRTKTLVDILLPANQ